MRLSNFSATKIDSPTVNLNTMTTPVAALLSPSGRWLATTTITSSPSSRVSIRDSNTGRLQCTIRCPTAFETLIWISDTILAAAVPHVTLLDVTRGVALSSSSSTNTKLSHHTAVAAVAAENELLYVLESKHHAKKQQAPNNNNNNKWVVYEYTTEQHLLRKIKVGKNHTPASGTNSSVPPRLWATPKHLVVASSSHGARVVQRATGAKVCKVVGTVGAVAESLACGTVGDAVVVWDLETGEVVGTVPTSDGVEEASLLQLYGKGDVFRLLLGNQQLFRVVVAQEDDATKVATFERVCTLPDRTSKLDSVLLCLHDELRAVRFTDGMECQALVVDTSNDPVVLQWSSEKTTPTSASLKRKQATILGPGQAGHEAKNLIEVSASNNKRACKEAQSDDSENDSDDDENMKEDDREEEEEEEAEGPIIAERLALLHKALEEEEERDQKQQHNSTADTEEAMTTESMYQLLHQALQSADKQQLEKALVVRDAEAIAATCRELDTESVSALLVALTHRLAAKPARADQWSMWLTAILSHNPHVEVEHLLPLQNLLEERLEIFPLLLELEGRLEQLTE